MLTPHIEGAVPKDMLCDCGCRRPHKCSVSRVVRSEVDANVYKLHWYATQACLNKHRKEA